MNYLKSERDKLQPARVIKTETTGIPPKTLFQKIILRPKEVELTREQIVTSVMKIITTQDYRAVADSIVTYFKNEKLIK